jgi:hypothetical protein
VVVLVVPVVAAAREEEAGVRVAAAVSVVAVGRAAVVARAAAGRAEVDKAEVGRKVAAREAEVEVGGVVGRAAPAVAVAASGNPNLDITSSFETPPLSGREWGRAAFLYRLISRTSARPTPISLFGLHSGLHLYFAASAGGAGRMRPPARAAAFGATGNGLY